MEDFSRETASEETGGLKLKEHFRKGMTAFLVIAASIVFYFALLRFDYISAFFLRVLNIVKPIIYGLVFAYLLNPIVKLVEKYVKKIFGRRMEQEKWVRGASRSIGILAALLFAAAVIAALFQMLIPELIKSIRDLVMALPGQIQNVIDYLTKLQEGDEAFRNILENILIKGRETFETWVETDLLRQTNALMTGLTTGVISVVNGVMDILIGLIVSVYVLYSKEMFLGQSRKLIYALMPPKRANQTLHIAKKSNEIFGGFLIGKLIDSAIIGVLCFIGVSILKMPYALLVSVIVGVTNVIPFFGPYIGAIPSTILILLADPVKGIYFIIFILLLQQLDGNIIGPRILGDSTGLSAFWVVFAILLGGGLFGVVGMIVGVPTFAVLYYIGKTFIYQKLEHKKLPTDTESYDEKNKIDDAGNFLPAKSEKDKTEEKEK